MKLNANVFSQAHDPGNGKLCQCEQCRATRVRRLSPFDHGTHQAYKVGCRCDECRAGQRRRRAK